jgi:rRNA maturation protein Rpf1
VILLTTSRRPTSRIRTFCRDLARSIPNIIRINRGKLSLDGIGERALGFNADRVVIVDRWKGGPGKIELFQIGPEGLIPIFPLMYIAGIRLKREFEGIKAKPITSLTITTPPEKNPQVAKIAEFLSNFLDIPLSSMDEAVSEYSAAMHISLNASCRTQITFMLLSENVEVGPRVTISHLVWETEK